MGVGGGKLTFFKFLTILLTCSECDVEFLCSIPVEPILFFRDAFLPEFPITLGGAGKLNNFIQQSLITEGV